MSIEELLSLPDWSVHERMINLKDMEKTQQVLRKAKGPIDLLKNDQGLAQSLNCMLCPTAAKKKPDVKKADHINFGIDGLKGFNVNRAMPLDGVKDVERHVDIVHRQMIPQDSGVRNHSKLLWCLRCRYEPRNSKHAFVCCRRCFVSHCQQLHAEEMPALKVRILFIHPRVNI